MKIIKWLASSIIIFGIIGCGSGDKDKKEAKELLQKILQVVGIPHEIVVNICQDGNGNGICDATDLQTKITLNRGDTFNDIWQKISLTPDGRYFLETMDRTKPVLLELQDEAKVIYDDGKFTIPFSGFKNDEQNETKELSILASLVDKGYFSDRDLTDIRSLNNPDTQNKFYTTLLNSLEENINILRAKGLNAQQSMLGNLKEIADELEDDGVKTTLADDLNRCGVDLVCVDTRLGTLGSKLLITDEEADTIVKEQQDSENQSSNSNSGSGKKLLVSKETVYSEQNFDDTTSSTTMTTTYTYNNKNQMQKSITTTVDKYNGKETYRSTRTCTEKYDNQDRYIGNLCIEESSKENQSNTSKDILNYEGNKVINEEFYNNGNLNIKWEVIKWDGNRAIQWKVTDYDNNKPIQTTVYTSTYVGNNPTHIESTSTNSDGSEIRYIIDRTFDNKKIPYYWEIKFMNINNIWWGGWLGENNIIKETYKTLYSDDYTYTSTTTNNITYNSSDMPTKIESTETTDSADFETYRTTTYEYIEAK